MLPLLLVSIQASVFREVNKCESNWEPGNYNQLFLATFYAAAQCYKYSPTGQLGPVRGTNEFSLHGLWPNFNASSYPSNCNNSYPFNMKEIEGIPDLAKQWFSNVNSDEYFYDHEWTKHGTCATDILPTIRDYFSKSIELNKGLDLSGILKRAGITPSNTKMYTKASVAAAFKAALGVDVLLECLKYDGKSMLSGVDVLYAHDANFRMIQPGSDYVRKYANKCPTSFYLPEIPDSCYRN
ncbi:putative Ribonuclease [Blattamonas nauphoetae]|uniref:Ribonuclease n=1 Tax=Blattamonas nauphoetae TaxID=2049346 RepID=A0ABQ9X9S2_9EUKA|nr:putative Ribonuclease [Blattamonas nauphoetae]